MITDLTTAVKELLENSLDAGATKVDIKLYNYGKDRIIVADNGKGIPHSDHKLLAHKHTTSKLVEFTDLESLESFGFRGEALSSLCAMSNLIVTTKTQNDQVTFCFVFSFCFSIIFFFCFFVFFVCFTNILAQIKHK